MFNAKQYKLAESPKPYETYLRDENLGPKADDNQPITEKMLPHREGDKYTTVEDWLNKNRKSAESDSKVIEKVLEESAKYRTGNKTILVPAISEAVARIEADRRDDFKSETTSDWTNNMPKQNGSLPKWPKMPSQHDKIVLPNDPRRFEGKEVKPLVGGITTADIDRTVARIKNGEAAEYDVAIAAILKEADLDERDLTNIEMKAISDLKIARTKEMLKIA